MSTSVADSLSVANRVPLPDRARVLAMCVRAGEGTPSAAYCDIRHVTNYIYQLREQKNQNFN
ncbi:hypothetical protein JGE30_24320 [Salmonella enterica subsp. enterica serovar Give]|nr:hypothetical protein [Salmonella enterica subsp. enterica serovar Give]